jgi:hypothetical protein
VAKHALDEAAAALDAEQLPEVLAELLLARIAGFECPHQPQRLGMLAEEPLDRVRIEALVDAEGAKGVEDVGGEDPAEVDQEALHPPRATSRAFSASAGTPSSKSAR